MAYFLPCNGKLQSVKWLLQKKQENELKRCENASLKDLRMFLLKKIVKKILKRQIQMKTKPRILKSQKVQTSEVKSKGSSENDTPLNSINKKMTK